MRVYAYINVKTNEKLVERAALERRSVSSVMAMVLDDWAQGIAQIRDHHAMYNEGIADMVRVDAMRLVGWNCTFTDDDYGTILDLAERAVKAGLTDGIDIKPSDSLDRA